MEYTCLDTSSYEDIMKRYHAGSLLARIVSTMGYSQDDLDSFFHAPFYERLQNDSLASMAAFLKNVKDTGEKAFVYGDYDCDGICATAIMVTVLERLGITNGYYIPNRFTEGYGLNLARVQQAHEKGYRVIITVDNGVSAHEALSWAREHGMKVAVTDHHLMEGDVECDVLCHPSLLPHDYQYMCGAGMAYLIADYLGLTDDRLTVLAMIATIGDVMELKGYNVQLVRQGLQLLNGSSSLNIEKLGQYSLPVDETEIAFNVVPKINSVGRMADEANPNQVVRFLLSDSRSEITALAQQIVDLNVRRRELTRQQYLLVEEKLGDEAFPVIYVEGLHEGVIGSMASRLTEEVHKPCLIFTGSGDLLKGSGRSIDGLNIMSVLEGFRDRTEALGGHAQACGISIKPERLEELKEYLKENYDTRPETKGVLDVPLSELTRDNLEEVFRYRPYGQGRKIPLLRIRMPNIYEYRQLKNDHQLKWTLDSDLSVLSFSNNDGYQYYCDADMLEFVGSLRENRFRGSVSYTLYADEVKRV